VIYVAKDVVIVHVVPLFIFASKIETFLDHLVDEGKTDKVWQEFFELT
jgi:hypothetical protein